MVYTMLLTAADFAFGPTYEVVIVGKEGSEDTKAMLKALQGDFLPNKVVVFRPMQPEQPAIVEIAQYTENQISPSGTGNT